MRTVSVMTLLREGVPITLLCDLVSTEIPDSVAINRAERPARDPIRLEVAEHASTAKNQPKRSSSAAG